jgi:ribosomal protein L23
MTKKQEMSGYEIVLYPLITEKVVNTIEKENKIAFVVNKHSGKREVKQAVEGLYKVRVENVRIVNDRKGRKKAIVKLRKDFKADDLATKLGVI